MSVMVTYQKLNSGVKAYEFGPDYIITLFEKKYYLYSDKITGKENVDQTKERAGNNKGLSGFISKYIKKNYEAMFETEKALRDYLKKR